MSLSEPMISIDIPYDNMQVKRFTIEVMTGTLKISQFAILYAEVSTVTGEFECYQDPDDPDAFSE